MNHSLLTILLASAWALPVKAQVPVVDAGSEDSTSQDQPAAQAPQGQGGNSGTNEVVVNLYLQLEALQEEVQNLRGTVEEQSYQIRRMKQEQEDRYLDLDRRLSALTGDMISGGGAGNNGAGGNTGSDQASARNTAGGGRLRAPFSGGDGPGLPSFSASDSPAAIPQSEQELYRSALNLLLEESDYEQSIVRFQEYIDQYPEGRYITNSHYWLGEALILASRYNAAGAAFRKVINDYPEDPKAAGAMLKLGVVQQRMGDVELARETWRNLQERYPDSTTEIRTARDYLRDSAGN